MRPFVDRHPEHETVRLAHECPEGAAPQIELVGSSGWPFGRGLAWRVRSHAVAVPRRLFSPPRKKFTRDSPPAKFFNGLMAEVVAAAQRAAGRPLRILEIGAGTGGTTAHILPRLQGQDVEYTFTDIGPLFVNAARERFGANAFMHFQTLDLEREPKTQGFVERQFDIIIAANVSPCDCRFTSNARTRAASAYSWRSTRDA